MAEVDKMKNWFERGVVVINDWETEQVDKAFAWLHKIEVHFGICLALMELEFFTTLRLIFLEFVITMCASIVMQLSLGLSTDATVYC